MSSRRVRPPRAYSRISSEPTPSRSAASPPAPSPGSSDSATEGRSSRRIAPHRVPRGRLIADGLAEEPDAVADVAGLVVMDQRIPMGESRQEPLAPEELGDEPVRRQAERALEDQVVERDEADLRLEVGGLSDQPLVRLHQRLVEDPPERGGDLGARPLHVGGDGGRRGDDLVLEPRVELHVTGLVDLLGRQESRLLLAAVGTDEAGELGRDPLLGDHQRSQHPVDQRSVRLAHPSPLAPVLGEVDRERAPLRALPVAIEGLRVVELDPVVAHEPRPARPGQGRPPRSRIRRRRSNPPSLPARSSSPAAAVSSNRRSPVRAFFN